MLILKGFKRTFSRKVRDMFSVTINLTSHRYICILTNVLSPDRPYRAQWGIDKMEKTKAIFEKEEAVRLLNYLVAYREMTESQRYPGTVTIGVIPKAEQIIRE